MPIEVGLLSGGLLDLETFSESDIITTDIAISLARQRRYAGHTVVPWSVAQHSILCSMIADKLKADKVNIKACFLHDFEECYVQDITAPLKRNFMLGKYATISKKVSKVIYDRFDCHGFNPEFVHTVDMLAYVYEDIAFRPNNKYDPHVTPEIMEKFEWMMNTLKFAIPHELVTMSEEEQANILDEAMVVFTAEKSFGQEISSEVDDVLEGINNAFGKVDDA